MGHPDFRVNGRIFATLSGQAAGRGVLKLTLDQQAAFIHELPEVFEPVQGGWGRMGMTYISLGRANQATMRGALSTAHRNLAQKQAATMKQKKQLTRAAMVRRGDEDIAAGRLLSQDEVVARVETQLRTRKPRALR